MFERVLTFLVTAWYTSLYTRPYACFFCPLDEETNSEPDEL